MQSQLLYSTSLAFSIKLTKLYHAIVILFSRELTIVDVFSSFYPQSMMLRIQKYSHNVTIMFTLNAFMIGWKETAFALCVIRFVILINHDLLSLDFLKHNKLMNTCVLWCRMWLSTLPVIKRHQLLSLKCKYNVLRAKVT